MFSHAALKLEQPECYHILMPGQHNNADELEWFRKHTYESKAAGGNEGELEYVHTPLEYVSTNHTSKGIKIPGSIARLAFTRVVDTSVQVCGHEGIWHEGVFMILAEGEFEVGMRAWWCEPCARARGQS